MWLTKPLPCAAWAGKHAYLSARLIWSIWIAVEDKATIYLEAPNRDLWTIYGLHPFIGERSIA